MSFYLIFNSFKFYFNNDFFKILILFLFNFKVNIFLKKTWILDVIIHYHIVEFHTLVFVHFTKIDQCLNYYKD